MYSNNPLVRRVCLEQEIDVRGIDLIERDRYRGSEIKQGIVDGKPWRALVPDPVATAIDEIDGVERLRRLSGDDGDAGAVMA